MHNSSSRHNIDYGLNRLRVPNDQALKKQLEEGVNTTVWP